MRKNKLDHNIPFLILILIILVMLTLIYLPLEKKIKIYSVRYNEDSHELKITLQNSFDINLSVQGKYIVTMQDSSIKTIGDNSKSTIGRNTFSTLSYDIEEIHPRKEVIIELEYWEEGSSIKKRIKERIIPTIEI